MQVKKEWLIIGRGFAGWHAKSVDCSSSGGDLLPYTFWTGEKCAGYLAGALEGCLVYDAADMERTPEGRAAFTQFVCSGPMVDLSLAPDGVSRFGKEDREAAARMLPGLSGGYATLAAIAIADETYSGLDSVGIGVYESLLRKLPGMRVGHVREGVIVWG